MKIVYIAHPIKGDVFNNSLKVRKIIREINLTQSDILPFAHYLVDLLCLNDDTPSERQRGINNDTALMKAGFIDEIWLYGDRISNGMKHEIELAKVLYIPIISKSEGTKYFDK
jgi:hypothetical protein